MAGSPDVRIVQLFLLIGILVMGGLVTPSNAQNKDTTALISASMNDHVEMARILIAAKADVNTEDNNGNNALSLTSGRRNADIVQLLKQAGAKE